MGYKTYDNFMFYARIFEEVIVYIIKNVKLNKNHCNVNNIMVIWNYKVVILIIVAFVFGIKIFISEEALQWVENKLQKA